MAIDAGIYSLAGRGVKSVAEYDAEASQAKQNKLAEMMGGMKMDEAKRGIAGQNALAKLIASGESGAGVSTGLAAQGFGNESMAYTKQIGEMAKQKAATEKDQLGNVITKLKLGAQILGGVKDQAGWDAARVEAQANGLPVDNMPPQFDPAFVAQKRQQSLSETERLEQYWKQKGYDTPDANAVLSAQTQATGQQIQRDGQQIQIRGQDLTDARARDLNTSKIEENKLKRESIPEKALTEGQSKALLFGSRMREADKVLNTLATEGTNTSTPGSRAPLIGGAITALSSGNQQMLDQAKRDFMSAVLRRESGAAISEGEYSNADKQYFPQIGDGNEVIAQKAKNRQLAMNGVLQEVPEKHRNSLQSSQPEATGRSGATGSWGDGKTAAPVSIKTAADYANIPSGATYIDPNGQMRKKP